MGKIVAFPNRNAEVAVTALKNSLMLQTEELDNIYDVLDALHGKLHELEKTCSAMELEYDKSISRYADRVGPENVEVEFLGYTSRHIVSVDADGENFTLTIQEDVCNED